MSVHDAGLGSLTDDQLRERARQAGIHDAATLRREELLNALDTTDDAMTRSEERLVAGTEVVETGRVRLRKYVVTEEVQITVPVRREELRVERVPIAESHRGLVEDPDVFGSDEVFGGPDGGVVYEITLHEERPLVTTEIVPVERVRLSKVLEVEQHIVAGEVRKERIEVESPDQASLRE